VQATAWGSADSLGAGGPFDDLCVHPGGDRRASAMGVLTNAMLIRMTRMTKRNQVLLGIVSGLAPQLLVVNF